MYWSMMIWAPFMKSPNCASHSTSASLFGDASSRTRSRPRRTPTAASRRPRTWPCLPGSVASGTHVLPGLVVDEAGVALAERAPPAVLAGEADRVPSSDERAEGQRLGGGPLHLALLVVQLRRGPRTGGPAWVGREALRVVGEVVEDPVELGAGRPRCRRGAARPSASAAGRALHDGRRGRAGLVEGRPAARCWKSSRAASASSRVMSPRFTSASVNSLRTLRRLRRSPCT